MAKAKEPIAKRTMFAGRFSESIKNKFVEIEQQVGREMSDAEIIEFLIQNSCSSENLEELEQEISTKNESLSQLKAENAKLEAENEDLKKQLNEQVVSVGESNAEEIQNLQVKIDNLTAENDSLKQDCQKLQNDLNESGKKLMQIDLLQKTPKKGCYTVALPPMADELMQVTVNRLRDKLKSTDLTPEKLLIDLFVKYTAKRPADFAYPFVISKDEFNVILSKYKKL